MEPSPHTDAPDYTEAYRRHRAIHRLRWLIILVLFLLINGGAILAPRFYHKKERARLEKLQTILTAQSGYLEREQTRLEGMQKEIDLEKKALAPLAKSIEVQEKKNPKGIPPADYQAYLKRVKDYNKRARALNDLAVKYDRAANFYRGDSVLYERYRLEADAITQKLRSTWNVLPLRLPSPAPPPPPLPTPTASP